MRDFRRRLLACALIVVSSIVVTEAQQQRGRGQDKSRADLAAAAGGVVTSVDSDGVPKFVWAAGARPGPVGATHDGAARWHLRQFARALDVTPADVVRRPTRRRADAQLGRRHRGAAPALRRRRGHGQRRQGPDARRPPARRDLGPAALRPAARDAIGSDRARPRSPRRSPRNSASPFRRRASTTETTAGGEQRFRLAAGSSLHMSEAAPVRPVMFPVGGRLVAAYVTEFYAGAADSVDCRGVSLRHRRRRWTRARTARSDREREAKDPTADAARATSSSIGCTPSRRTSGRSTARSRTSARIRPASRRHDVAVPAVESRDDGRVQQSAVRRRRSVARARRDRDQRQQRRRLRRSRRRTGSRRASTSAPTSRRRGPSIAPTTRRSGRPPTTISRRRRSPTPSTPSTGCTTTGTTRASTRRPATRS